MPTTSRDVRAASKFSGRQELLNQPHGEAGRQGSYVRERFTQACLCRAGGEAGRRWYALPGVPACYVPVETKTEMSWIGASSLGTTSGSWGVAPSPCSSRTGSAAI